jgi:Fe-S oxidoreductase
MDASPKDIISGVLDIVRTGQGHEASGKWATSCMLSGDCIKACDYGVNPRFLLAMARVAMAKAGNELRDLRRQGVEKFHDLSRDVTVLSRLQLDSKKYWNGSAKNRRRYPGRTRLRTSYSTPAAMCLRRRTSRCSLSISWMCSASPIE